MAEIHQTFADFFENLSHQKVILKLPDLYYTANVLSAETIDECLQTKSKDN